MRMPNGHIDVVLDLKSPAVLMNPFRTIVRAPAPGRLSFEEFTALRIPATYRPREKQPFPSELLREREASKARAAFRQSFTTPHHPKFIRP